MTVFINPPGYIQAGNLLIGKGDGSIRTRIDELIHLFPYSEKILVKFANLYISYEQIKVNK
ncbi:MAG: hypothetical protein R2685_12870 [Candidatus Nitrosocosmicus sp.]|nr:hypothetical protein [Candidatus Nitrosocosmicus sp.]